MAQQTDGELLLALGTDGLAWAEKFTKVLSNNSAFSTTQLNIISELAVGYFANAIEHAKSVGRAQREVPGELLQVEQLQADIEGLKRLSERLSEERDQQHKSAIAFHDQVQAVSKERDSARRELHDVRQCASTLARIMDKIDLPRNAGPEVVINFHAPCTFTATS